MTDSLLQPYTLDLPYTNGMTQGLQRFHLLGSETVAIGNSVITGTWAGEKSTTVGLELWISSSLDGAVKNKIIAELRSNGLDVYPSSYLAAAENEHRGSFFQITMPNSQPLSKDAVDRALDVLVQNDIVANSDKERVGGLLLPDESILYQLEDKTGTNVRISFSRVARLVKIAVYDSAVTDRILDEIRADESMAAGVQKHECQILIPCDSPLTAARKFETVQQILRRCKAHPATVVDGPYI